MERRGGRHLTRWRGGWFNEGWLAPLRARASGRRTGEEMAGVASAVRRVLARHPAERSELIPILQEVQDAIGYLPQEALRLVADHLNVPEASVYGVASFYAQFYLEPQGRHKVRVCRGTACHLEGSERLCRAVRRKLGVRAGETTPDGRVTYETFECTGVCPHGPVVVVDGEVHGRMTARRLVELLGGLE